jgi:uncharacterized protein YciI
MTLYAVRYTYDERSDTRDVVRPEHRAYLGSLADQGLLLGSGPLTGDGQPGALLVFATGSRDELDDLLAADPFAREGLIAATEVRGWDLVIGPWAAGR